MTIEAGQHLLHYRLTEKIGEGGMGVVWKAQDTRLDRTVAIKVLPEGFRRDPERLTRLEREAKLLAALNHTNVASIHGFEEAEGGVRFLVLEYVPGESLDARIARGPLPLEQVLRYARQIVDAVEAAHRQGIIHRDLKPANIKVTPDDRVKVLDFGLAKALVADAPPALDDSPTMTGAATRAGVILGTAPYMSPEQARGHPIDARTDIWAFGCIVYEMLTGSRAFGGGTVTDVLAGIVHKDPDWNRLPRTVSKALVDMLRRCLAKDEAGRPQEIGLLRPALDAATARPAGRPRTLAAVGAAAAVLLILALGFVGRRTFFGPAAERPAASPDPRLMLVVLPFDNLGADPDREFFADGLTEEVIAQLARLSPERLGVIARTSSMHYKGTDKSIEQIGRELGVGYVLEGSVRLAGQRVRINAQLIDAADQTNLWAEIYERDVTEIFAIQGDVAGRVARSLSLELLPAQREQLSRAATTVPAAHEAYLKGRFYWNKRTVPDLRKSIELFQKATRLDPEYAEAWRGLADGWAVLPDYDPPAMDEARPEARRAAHRALELDPTLVEARAPLAMLLIYDWEWEAAESALRQVIAERPGFATARHWYAWLLIEMNRKDEALEQIRRARELDPLSIIINSNVAQMLLSAERYEEALAEFERVFEMDPDFRVARTNYAYTLLQLGRGEEAIEVLESLRSEFGGDVWLDLDLAQAHAIVGDTAEAERWLEKVGPAADTAPLGVAAALVALGRNDEALTALERGCAERNANLRHLFTHHYIWESLEHDPRFRAIEECVHGK